MFLGHVGGDDFFIATQNLSLEDVTIMVQELLENFCLDVESFYDSDARDRGFIIAKDRNGETCHFPLMSCSAALIALPAQRAENTPSFQDLDTAIADLKKQAKMEPSHMAITSF